jgi:hypothetical protein
MYFASYKVFAVCTSPENSIFLCVNKQENVVSKTISGKVIFIYMTEKLCQKFNDRNSSRSRYLFLRHVVYSPRQFQNTSYDTLEFCSILPLEPEQCIFYQDTHETY